MKKLFTSLMLSALISFSALAQMPDGSICPDFTGTDLDGNTWNLYELLDQGYTVIIEVSATWCGPCWNYHNTNHLKNLYNQYGPEGTVSPGEVFVLFIEGDNNTNTNCLYGSSGCNSSTQGNWVAGTPFPIIDSGAIASLLQIGYYPTIYTVCPNRIVVESGQLTAANHYQLVQDCPAPASEPIDPAILQYTGATQSCDNFALSVLLQNYGTEPLTSCTISVTGIPNPINYNWTGNLNTYQLETVNLGNVTLSSSANATISITSTDGNPANSTLSVTLNYIDASQSVALPSATNFAAAGFPYANWRVLNPDNGITWEIANGGSAQGNALFINTYSYNTTGQLDDVITMPFNLSGTTNPSLSFKVANRRYNGTYWDKLRVSVSTSCDGPWTEVWYKENQALATGPDMTGNFTSPTASEWRTECVNLNAYAGSQGLFVKFTNVNNYGNNIFVDDISVISTECTVNVNELADATTSLHIYPNPFSGVTNLDYNLAASGKVSISVLNMLGEQVKAFDLGTQPAGPNRIELDLTNMTAGVYFVHMATENQVITKKITLTK